MGAPRTAPYGWVRLADVDTLAQVDPRNPDVNDCAFHLIRRHFDVQAFGVNAATGNTGDEMTGTSAGRAVRPGRVRPGRAVQAGRVQAGRAVQAGQATALLRRGGLPS